MAYNGVNRFTKPHGSGNGGDGTRIQVINKGNGTSNFDPNYVDITNLNAHNAYIDNLTVTNATIDNAQFKYIMSPNGVINKIQGDEINYSLGRIDDLSSGSIATTKLNVNDEANIENLIASYINSKEITTDYLTVNKSAHFFELIIDKIRSVQGTQMNTAANCIADFIEAYDSNDTLLDMTDPDFDEQDVSYYRIYFKNTDYDGRSISNDWLQYDQAICESFNVNTGVSYDVSNKYYWRLVERTDGGTVKYINFNTKQVVANPPATFEICMLNGFAYGDDVDPTDNFTDFTITSQIIGEWSDSTYIWTPSTTLYGLQVTVNPTETILAGGGFIFETDIPTKLNVGVYYDDGTYAYFQADEYKYSYNITTDANKNVEAFVICTADIDKWEACHWIDLSNTDCDTGLIGKSAIPSAGDNICQLGYRYTSLSGYENTAAWRQAHKDEVARASAIIIAAYETPDVNVYPPSYAQYQDITRFILGDWSEGGVDYSNRGTYFDATGAYFKGNLVAGTTADPGLNIPVNVDDWRISADTSVVTKDTNNNVQPALITLSLLHNNGTTTTEVTTLPSDKKVYVNGQDNYYAYTGGVTHNPLEIDTSYFGFVKYNIELKSYTGTPQTYDKLVIDKFDINASNGRNGSYYQFIYKNDTEMPSRPTQDAFPPSGWSTTATTPLDGEYTFMSQRTVSFTAANVEQHSTWTSPIRISGDNGINGVDGAGVEFIYYATDQVDNQGNPICADIIKLPNPVIQDDSLVRYYDRDNPDEIRQWREYGMSDWHYESDMNYLPPSDQSGNYLTTTWTDEPTGVSEDCKYEFVAVRTFDPNAPGKGAVINPDTGEYSFYGAWSDFSTALWAKYGENGVNGVNGVNGIDGKDGEGWFLVPIVHEFAVNIKTGTNYDNIVGVVKTDFKFAVQHIDGDTREYLTAAELADYSLNLITDNTSGRNICRSTDTYPSSQVSFSITTISVDNESIPVISVTSPNYLRYTSNVQSDETSYSNYYYLHSHISQSQYANAMFNRITVQLVKTGIAVMDDYTQDLIFKADHIFAATDNALNSVYQGISGDTNTLTNSFATGFSKIHQAWDNINLNVNNLTTVNKLPVSNNITQYAWYRCNNTNAPVKPVGDISQSGNVDNQWTSYNYPYPNGSYQYLYCSQRTRSQNAYIDYGSWSYWSDPVIMYTYTGGIPTIANSATLDIKANEINSTVAATYLTQSDAASTYTTLSQVRQTATQISAQVKTDIEGELSYTGIDITNGQITLNADHTIITGTNLVLEQDQGIVIKDSDDYNNITIQGNDIDTFGASVTYFIGGYQTLVSSDRHSFTSASDEYTFNFPEIDLGRLPQGSVITAPYRLNNSQAYNKIISAYKASNNTSVTPSNASTCVISYELWKKGSNSDTQVCYETWYFTGATVISGSFNYTVQDTYEDLYALVKIQPLMFTSPLNTDIYLIGNFQIKVQDTGSDSIKLGTNGYNVISKYTYTVNDTPTSASLNEYLKNDEWRIEDTASTGLVSASNRTGLRIIRQSPVPQQKASYNYDYLKYDDWCTVGSVMRVTSNNATTNVNRGIDVYLFWGTNSCVLNMSVTQNTAQPSGKVIYVKNLTNQNLTCNAGAAIMFNLNSASAVSSITLSSGQQATFIWDSEHWLRLS